MDHERRAGRHPDLDRAAEEARRGRMSRRGFLRVAALLGAGVGIGAAASRLQHRGALAVEPAAGAPRTGGTLRCAMSVFDIADPARFAWVEMSNQARHQHEHLTVTGPDNITRPMLAERWAAADDLKTWTFHLRRGVRWHSGDPFTADDVAFNIARWLDPELGSSTLALFSGLTGAGAGVEVVDPHTLRLHLSAPLLSVPENFYNYPTALVHRGFSGDVTRDRNGTGPYQIVENAPGEISISRRRTAGDQPYWGAAVPHVGPGLLDEIRYVHHEAASPEAVEAVISGAVDMCYEVGVESFERAAEAPETRLLVADSALTGCLRMRVDAAPFDDVRVRRAIQLCCDAEAYPDQVFSGRGRPGEHHHVARIHPDYFPLDPPPRDAAQARRLLAEAGFADGLDLTLDVGNTSGLWQQRTAELFARQASEAGVRVRVNMVGAEAYRDIWRTTPFGLTQWVHRPLGTMALALGYRSIAPWNETGYANPDFDAALSRAEALIDISDRREAMAPVQRMLQEDAVIVQPVWLPIFMLASDKLRGLEAQPTQYHEFNRVWIAEA